MRIKIISIIDPYKINITSITTCQKKKIIKNSCVTNIWSIYKRKKI